jgi:hypothetical protein
MRFASVLGALALAACNNSVVVQLRTGPQTFEVSTTDLMLPEAARDSADRTRIASLPCGPGGLCPASPEVPITCEGGVCNPAAVTISAPIGAVVDFDVLTASARELVRHIDTIEILEATYEIPMNTLTFEVPPIELFWGPEGAVDVDPSMGVVALGTMPAIPAGSTTGGAIALDGPGVAAMSDYLVHTSRRIRFFARTRVDLEPGGPFPEGSLRISVDMLVRITGSIVR